MVSAVQDKAEATRQLAYPALHALRTRGVGRGCRAYNEIVTSWSAIESAACGGTNAAADVAV